ncbi:MULTISPECIES: acetoin utilization protein AcuC [unclassified Azospirillum]|uniref:acetoin utilization protein AcuC n=1 Tax=unclassified Azospirillum TaxID=2630922 RepID=UPI000B6881A5|nr:MULTISPECIES: acetoin utilization protein AcuC [unclassified Azospirillum]SNS36185.1 acetoin utilization protein AcuC [Azospirillum sp. RU38E]SNS54479.1 acetoin utilization protein AcuC [Azospirillum sp. RU37A]
MMLDAPVAPPAAVDAAPEPLPKPSAVSRPLFLGGEIYRHSSYGKKHPLSIPRVTVAMDLARAMGWLDESRYLDSPMATEAQLARFHERDYIAAVQQAERDQRVDLETAQRYGLGKLENPVFPEMYRRPAIAVGAAIQAAELLRDGGVVYSPASGTHHARPGRASGFCFFNAPVLGILSLLDQGLDRILYIDLDAHHGDGVQDAFHDDERVLTVSIHEGGRWPYTGKVEDRAGGMARNLPVPAGFHDSELRYLVEEALIPLACAFRPQAMVIQTGADALADDPLSRLSLSNRALWHAVSELLGLAPRTLVVGGGGYNPWSVGRAWAGIWAVLCGIDPAGTPLTPEAVSVLRGLTWDRREGRNPPAHWFDRLHDAPREGPVREEIRMVAAATRDL